MFNIKNKRFLNQKGFTLTELMVAIAILTIITVAVARVMVTAIGAVMVGTRQSIAQSSVEQVINLIAEDIRQAGSDDQKHIRTGSNGTSVIFTRYQQNLDGYSNNGDMNFDHACYSFVGPTSSNAYSDSYRPGYIRGGSGSGDPDNPGCPNVYPLTDTYADVRDFRIEFCRPGEDSVGDYDCTMTPIDNSGIIVQEPNLPDLTDSAACVWLVKISATYSRRYITKGDTVDPSYYSDATFESQTAVMLRNPYIMSTFKDQDKDGFVDCCDKDFRRDLGNDITWCPPPNSM